MAAKSPKNVQATAPEQTTNLPVPLDEITEAKAVELGPLLYTEANSLTPYIEHIKASVNEVPDLTTTKGRDRIASLAASVSRSKTAIEKPGRAYLKHIKAVVKPVEQNLKAFVDSCDALRDEVRAPLTKWEEEQRANQERLQSKVDYFGEEYQSMLENMPSNLHERADFIKAVLDDIKAEPVGDDFESMKEAGQAAKAQTVEKMTLAYQAALIESDNQRKADAQAEQERLAREKQIAEEAAAKAKADAETAAKAKIEQAEREKQEAIQREEQQRYAAIREQEAAKQREQQAAEQAAANERARIQREQEAKEAAERQAKEEADRKAANVEHRRKINQTVMQHLIALGATEELSKVIITAAAKGELGAMTISY
ncbi:hypothetical protein [Shewanella sp. Koi 1]